MVYLIEMEGQDICKIGRSTNPVKRLANLQVASPHKLTLRGVMKGDVAKEAEMHRQFAAQRMSGEWFRLSDEITALFKPMDETDLTVQEVRAARKTNGYLYLIALDYDGDALLHQDITGLQAESIDSAAYAMMQKLNTRCLIFCTEESPVARTAFEGGDAFRKPYPAYPKTL